MTVLLILFGAGFTVLVCFALGGLILRPSIGSKVLNAQEAMLLEFVIGSGALSWTVFLLALAGFARATVLLGLGAIVIACALYLNRRKRLLGQPEPLRKTWLAAYIILFLGFGAYYFVHALKPEASPDGATYHLGLVARFLREGGISAVRENMYAAFPKGMEMLNLFAFAFGRHSAAALVHFSFLLALVLSVFTFARQEGRPVAGVIASMLLLLSPAVAWNGTAAYNDVALALACFTTFWLIELWKRRSSDLFLALAGLVAGFAFTIKYTGAVAVVYLLLALVIHARRNPRVVLQKAVLVSMLAAATAVPYLAHNWIVRGNPLAPFFNTIFPNPYVHISFENMAREMGRHYPGLTSYWHLPWEVIIRGGVTQGFFGPVFLLAPLALVSLRDKLGRSMLAAAALFALPFLTNTGTRFLIPALPFVCLALGLVLDRWPRIGAVVLAVHAITVLPPVARLYAAPGVTMLSGWPLHAALRLEPEDKALDRMSPGIYDVAKIINRNVPPSASVLALAWVMEAYTVADIRTHHLSAANERLAETLWTPVTPELQPLRKFSFSFPKRRLRAVRLIQTVRARPVSVARREAGFILNRPRIHPDHWGIAELRLGLGGLDVESKPAWAFTASPNRWDAGLALDRNPTTAWKTWQTASPGMFFEIDFSGFEELDHVSFVSPLAQTGLAFQLEGRLQSGDWVAVESAPEETRIEPPADMRELAVSALAREGIHYVLIDPSLWGAEDISTRAEEWGLRSVDQSSSGVRLYKITLSSGSTAPAGP